MKTVEEIVDYIDSRIDFIEKEITGTKITIEMLKIDGMVPPGLESRLHELKKLKDKIDL